MLKDRRRGEETNSGMRDKQTDEEERKRQTPTCFFIWSAFQGKMILSGLRRLYTEIFFFSFLSSKKSGSH
jgi:hypothetical protein